MHAGARCSRAYSFRQWRRDDGAAGEAMAGNSRHAAAVYRAGESLGKRILRIIQRKAARRVSERRDFLFVERSAGSGGNVAEALQHGATAQLARISRAGADELDRRGVARVV